MIEWFIWRFWKRRELYWWIDLLNEWMIERARSKWPKEVLNRKIPSNVWFDLILKWKINQIELTLKIAWWMNEWNDRYGKRYLRKYMDFWVELKRSLKKWLKKIGMFKEENIKSLFVDWEPELIQHSSLGSMDHQE